MAVSAPVTVEQTVRPDGTVEVLYGRGPGQRYRVVYLQSTYTAERVERVRHFLADLPDWGELPYVGIDSP